MSIEQEKLNNLGNACIGNMSRTKRLFHLRELYEFTKSTKLIPFIKDLEKSLKLNPEKCVIDRKVVETLLELLDFKMTTEISREFYR